MLFSFVNQFFNDGAGNISVLNRAFTVFSALKSSEKVGGSFLESRIIRLKISVDIFSSYGLLEKLVGGGFGYLEEIAVVTGVDYDYPHNILVSVLLSNGILGLLFYSAIIFFLFYASFVYRFFPYNILFLIFIIFVFTSGDQFFTNQGFMMITILIITFYNNLKNNKKKYRDINNFAVQ